MLKVKNIEKVVCDRCGNVIDFSNKTGVIKCDNSLCRCEYSAQWLRDRVRIKDRAERMVRKDIGYRNNPGRVLVNT